MKILFCTNKFNDITNGPAKFANLILNINKSPLRCQVKILTEDIEKPVDEVFKLKLTYPRYFKIFGQFFRMYFYHREAMKIKKKEFDFDVLVYNNAFIGLLSSIKFENTVGMINDDNNASKGWKNFKFEYTFIKQFIFKQFERLAANRMKLVISNSDYLTKYLVSAYPSISSKIVKLYKAIEKPEQVKSIDPLLSKKSRINIIFVKSDFIRGGLKELIFAIQKIKGKQFKLTIIGPPLNAMPMISDWSNNMENLELDSLGPQNQEFVYNKMINSDIFCVPSRMEALGVANIEAMARALPVISTNVGGIPEVLDHGNNGWMTIPADPKKIAETIIDCITQDELRIRKIANGLEFAKKFSLVKMQYNFYKILQVVISKEK